MKRKTPFVRMFVVFIVIACSNNVRALTDSPEWCAILRDSKLIVVGTIQDTNPDRVRGSLYRVSTISVREVLFGDSSLTAIRFSWSTMFFGERQFSAAVNACFFLEPTQQPGTYQLTARSSWADAKHVESIRKGVDVYRLHTSPDYRRSAESEIDTTLIEHVFEIEPPFRIAAIDSIEGNLYIDLAGRRNRHLNLAVTRASKDEWFKIRIRRPNGALSEAGPGDERLASLQLLRGALLPFAEPAWGERYWRFDYPCPFDSPPGQPRDVLAYRNALCRLRHTLKAE